MISLSFSTPENDSVFLLLPIATIGYAQRFILFFPPVHKACASPTSILKILCGSVANQPKLGETAAAAHGGFKLTQTALAKRLGVDRSTSAA
jgi:hypothetical protein